MHPSIRLEAAWHVRVSRHISATRSKPIAECRAGGTLDIAAMDTIVCFVICYFVVRDLQRRV